ncbi:insulinase family protein [Vibrio penaeicida]|uniref:Peptidase M16 n=2 Tax=Vibrio penaeicida TaxID=104609 RepID=A0AAV5P2T4_9VIBR|nr:insulinase family protein [Vibrio penaeicida]GLQ76484.1 peptidase M16 [Vibrio penaeicida]
MTFMFTQTSKPFALLLLATCSFFAHSSQQNDALWYTPTDIPTDETVQLSQLDNGMRVIMIDNDLPKQSMSIQMYIDAGSQQDPQPYSGLAHFLEHMAFNGSTHVEEGAMIPMLEKHGLAFGADTNASTDLGYTTYELDLPKATPEAIETALFLLRETASELTLSPSAIERERGVIQAERRVRGTREQQRYIDRIQYLLGDSNVYERLPIGTESSINKINRDALKSFYERYYRPEHTTLVVSGAIHQHQMMKKVQEHFASWQPKSSGQAIVDPTITYSLPKKTEAYANIDPKNRYIVIGLNFISPRDNAPYGKKQHLAYLNEIIALRAFNHRLKKTVERNDADGKLRYPGASLEGQSGVVRIRNLSVITDEGGWKHGLQTLNHTLKQATTFGFSEREIQRQIESYEGSLENQEEQRFSTHNTTLSNRVVNALDSGEPLVSERTVRQLFVEMKSQLTVESVNRAFQTHWSDSAARLYLDDRSAPSNINKQMLDAYQAMQKEKVEPYKEQESQAFAYTDFGPAGKVTELKPTQFGDIKRYQFENGVMLNVKPTDLEINTVYLTINFGQGLLGFNEHDAPLGSVFAPAIILSGVNKHTMDELQEMFGGSSLSASLKAQYNSFVSEVALDSLDVFDQLRFSTALLTDNGYRKEGWESAVRQWADFLASYESEPNSVLGRQSSAILHGGDNRWSVHSLEQVRRLSIKDAKSVLDKAIKKGPVEISLVGDISLEQAVHYVANTFGALDINAQAPAKPFTLSLPTFKTEPVTLFHTGDAENAIVSAYWKVSDGSDPLRNIRHSVLHSILQSKVTETIREKMGVAYSPSVYLEQSNWLKDFGYINIESRTALKDVEKVEAVYQQIWQALQKAPISQEELERAKAPILETLAQKPQYNGYWSNVASVAQSRPALVENEVLYIDALKSITVEDIQRLAQSISEDEYLSIRVVPKP